MASIKSIAGEFELLEAVFGILEGTDFNLFRWKGEGGMQRAWAICTRDTIGKFAKLIDGAWEGKNTVTFNEIRREIEANFEKIEAMKHVEKKDLAGRDFKTSFDQVMVSLEALKRKIQISREIGPATRDKALDEKMLSLLKSVDRILAKWKCF
jgi:hypothetical protein